jgi:hypothetical protein
MCVLYFFVIVVGVSITNDDQVLDMLSVHSDMFLASCINRSGSQWNLESWYVPLNE